MQRDLLPIVEGMTVTTRYGPVRTHHVLFVAAGAFHISSPSDLIPERQASCAVAITDSTADPVTAQHNSTVVQVELHIP